jgi:uncharacterized OB-fold protein
LTTQQQPATEVDKKPLPIVAYLHLPESPGEEPYLSGNKCRACGAVYVGSRMACSKCSSPDLEEMRFSNVGEIWTFGVVHQSFPNVPTPFVAAIIDLPEGASVRATVTGLDPNQPGPSWFGKKVQMYVEKAYTDKQGNDIIAYKYRPVEGD